MKKFFLTVVVFTLLAAKMVNAQTPELNHITIFVVDLQKSAQFYKNVLQLPEIPEPFHDNHHVWLKAAAHTELHVVSGSKAVFPHDISIHMAFTVDSVEAFAKHLDAAGVKYGNWAQTSKEPQVRPDGVKQIYLQDPDGYWIEINNDRF